MGVLARKFGVDNVPSQIEEMKVLKLVGVAVSNSLVSDGTVIGLPPSPATTV